MIRHHSSYVAALWSIFILHMVTLCSLYLSVSVSITVREQEQTGQGWYLQCIRRCRGLSGASFKSLHSSPVVPLTSWPLLLHPACSSFLALLFPPFSVRRRVAVRRTYWHYSWQQLSVSAINYTDWLTSSPTLILAFYSPCRNLHQLQQHSHLASVIQIAHSLQDHHPLLKKGMCIIRQTGNFFSKNNFRLSLDKYNTVLQFHGDYVASPRV